MADQLTMGCSTCHAKLWQIQNPDGTIEWVHKPMPEDDHEPTPAPMMDSQVHLMCDFCRTDLGRSFWAYPCKDFVMLIVDGTKYTHHVSVGDWAVCDHCYDLIEAHQKTELIAWSLAHHRIYTDHPAYRMVWSAFSRNVTAFFQNIQGPAYREEFDD